MSESIVPLFSHVNDEIVLQGEHVTLVPLELSHAEQLYECSRDPEVWEYFVLSIHTIDQMKSYIEKALSLKQSGEQYPFVIIDRATGLPIGSTRFLRISEHDKTINIGWTWLSKSVWRTAVNTESKYLLLQYAFEVWKARRVELITTTENIRSQQAIERLGAVREGILRKKYRNTDYVFYSIIDEEWSQVKARLEGMLER